MAELTGKTINDLPNVSPLSDTDLFPVSSGGASGKASWSTIKGATALNKSEYFSSGGATVESVDGRKAFGYVEAYVRLLTSGGASTGTSIGTIKSAYRPLHTVCFPLLSSSSPYNQIGSIWLNTDGVATVYFSGGTPQYAYLMYATSI